MPRYGFLALLLLAAPVTAGAEPRPALADRVDKHVALRWTADKITPAERADDAAFVRRVYLDLVGRIPTVAETRDFLADETADKRAKLADTLLASAAFARHAATVWRREWVPQADTPQFAHLTDNFEAWLADEFNRGTGLDAIARNLLTASRATEKVAPTTFLAAGEYRPETLAANTARAFLGVNLDCAQCHDHPFARWTRDQFWQTAAFFARPTADAKLLLALPGGKKTVGPKLLDDADPKWPAAVTEDTGRAVLAGWVTARGNPYFAKNAVNRAWAHLFGTGLVEPLDDLSGQNPASHPELLDELAAAFEKSGYDLKGLYAALVRTKAYQLSSKGKASDPRRFARAAVRGLSGEQLYDSLRVAAGLPADRADLDPLAAGRARRRFAERFRVDRPGTAQRSILQSLALMNNEATADLTDPAKTPTLRAVADAPFLDAAGKVESLFLAAYGRKPSADELKLFGTDAGADRLADLFWALLNTAEFNTNH
jgi:hypothetical protein